MRYSLICFLLLFCFSFIALPPSTALAEEEPTMHGKTFTALLWVIMEECKDEPQRTELLTQDPSKIKPKVTTLHLLNQHSLLYQLEEQ